MVRVGAGGLFALATLCLMRVAHDRWGTAVAKAKEEGDWSEPPAHGPRREGAPLNLDAEQQAEALTREPGGNPDKPSEELSHRT